MSLLRLKARSLPSQDMALSLAPFSLAAFLPVLPALCLFVSLSLSLSLNSDALQAVLSLNSPLTRRPKLQSTPSMAAKLCP